MTTKRNALARRRARGLSPWGALWLMVCLLLAQHAGLTHRVVHGGLLNVPLVATAPGTDIATDIATDAATDGDASGGISAVGAVGASGAQDHHGDPFALKLGAHSCVLFDGATLAHTHFGTPALPLLRFGKPVKPASLAWRWPDLPSRHPFHSRAPPAPLAFA